MGRGHCTRGSDGQSETESSVLGGRQDPCSASTPGAAPAADRVWVPGKLCPILLSVTAKQSSQKLPKLNKTKTRGTGEKGDWELW